MNDSKKAEQPEENPNLGETSKPSEDSEQPRVELSIDAAAEKDFDKIGAGKHQKQILAKIESLEQNPLPNDAKPIKGENFKANGWNFYRVDAGEYRIVYDLDEQSLVLTVVTITVIAARNDDKVYKLLQRRFG